MSTDAPIEGLLALLEQKAPRPLSIPEMARLLHLDRYDRRAVQHGLDAAVAARTVRRIGKTRYQWLRPVDRAPAAGARSARSHGRVSGTRIEGHYARVRAGYGFVEVLGRAADRFPRDILIPAGSEGGALHGDRVAVDIVRRDPRLRRVVGRVVAVTGPVHETMIGRLERHRGDWVLVPESALLPPVEIIGAASPQPGDDGLVGRVRLTRPATPTRPPGGTLEAILGAPDDPDVQFLTIAGEHGLRIEFPDEVLAAVAQLPDDPTASDCTDRTDLRHLPFMTIDGETARDFDDAVCLDPTVDHGTRLWVAIADVSHYVEPGTPLDREAAARGTSVYFPDRAIPMLPAQLSSQLCSLNPERDRLVLAVALDYDGHGHRRDARVCRAVIHSRARLTYTQVAAVLADDDVAQHSAWRAEFASLRPQLDRMRTLMRRLYRARIAAGSLDLDLPEALVDLSEAGRSIGLRLLERTDAHRLIEEFMLEANRVVAAYLAARDVPLPYRIHEPPDPDDIDDLNRLLGPFGCAVDYEGSVRPNDVQALLRQLARHRLARVLSRLVLRSLKQAQYATVNVGHFGLAFPIYCHFTSPIRRYPDLLVHRQVAHVLDGEVDAARALAPALEQAAVTSSQAERQAMEAERAMLDLKKAEFMRDHLHEPGAGTIVSVLPFGFFVELDAYPVEGLVRADGLLDDRYAFIEREQALVGLRRRQRFRLGDRVQVEAVNVSLRRREIDFALLASPRGKTARAHASTSSA